MTKQLVLVLLICAGVAGAQGFRTESAPVTMPPAKIKPIESKRATRLAWAITAADSVAAATSAAITNRNLHDYPGLIEENGGAGARATAGRPYLYAITQIPPALTGLCVKWTHGRARYGCAAVGIGELAVYGWAIHHNEVVFHEANQLYGPPKVRQ